MKAPPIRFSLLRWLHNMACALGFVGGFVAIVLGIIGFGTDTSGWWIAAGGFALLLVVMLIVVMPLLLAIESTMERQLAELRQLKQGIARHSASLELIAQNTGISDAAKSFAHREQEAAALREVIREEIRGQRWEAALSLIDAMEQRFGYKQEADAVRTELEEARGGEIRAKLAEAIDLIEQHFTGHDWERAQGEIDRLMNALPGNSKVAALVDRMRMLRERHKEELKASWQEAIRRSDTDQAIDLLRELDQYLTPAEAHTLQSSARDVFKEKLLQLGVQFRFAVTEKRWSDALTTGLELVRDFPNARMATEVRTALDTLRERARQQLEDAEAARS